MRSITKVTRVGLVTALVSIVWTGSLPLSTTASADSGCPTAAAPPVSGSVYQVSTPAHFQWIKDANASGSNAQWTYSYVQTANIDMTGCTWTSSIAASNDFSGTFDGGGYTISNLALGSGAVGVFDGIRGSISNTHLRDITFNDSTATNVGLLATILRSGGVISGSSATGTLTGGGNLGGLVGGNVGTIEDSWADVTVNDPSSGTSGGLVGINGIGGTVGAIRRSFSTGNVQAPNAGSRAGGLVGWNASGSIISDSYAMGSVTGEAGGGLIGLNEANVSRSYATGSVSASTAHGLIGAASGSPSYTANFWDTQTSGQSSPGPGGSEATGKTTAQMTTYATFADAGWSITNGYSTSTTWGICPEANGSYPFLVATQSSNPCAVDPQAAAAEFTYLLPDGRECTSISPERVIVGTVHQLPGREALCQTAEGSLVAGWVIPVPEGFTGAGSHANPFNPGHKVFVIESQRFTLVPYERVLTITYDANVATDQDCRSNNVVNASADEREQSVWVPRTDFAMARTTSLAPCTPGGHMLVGWNTAGDGTGESLDLGAELPEVWATNTANDHTLYAVWEASPAAD